MIKTTILYLFLMVYGNPPQVLESKVSDLDECVKQGLSFMVTESRELNTSGKPYKQAFVCEEVILPSN